MIIALVLVVAALVVGGLLAALISRDPGYVLIAYDDLTLETSLWLAVGTLLAVWLAVWTLAFVIRRLLRGGFSVTDWAQARRLSDARGRSLQGMMLLAEERWREAERALFAAAERVETPLANYFGAARAANALGRFEERDRILNSASKATPKAAFAVELARSELQQTAGQWRSSVTTLNGLKRQAPRHPLVLKRLFKAYQTLADWDAAAELAPALPDAADADLEAVRVALWRARLGGSRDRMDVVEHAHNTWKAMPKKLHGDELVLLDYVDLLAAHDAGDEAESILRRTLKGHWRSAWVRRYGLIPAAADKRWRAASGWLKDHPADPALLLTLGRLAAEVGELAQAREHLEASLALRVDSEVLEELGRLCAASGDTAAASDYFRRALATRV